jgi:putative tricarboxylic transport membrane protein
MLENLPLSFTLILGIVLANIIAGAICFATAPYLIKVAVIRGRYVIPTVLVLVYAGAYASGQQMLNIPVAILAGLLGFFMDRFGYPRAALLLGFVLGSLFEEYFFHAYKTAGPLFFTRPISLGIIALIVLFLSWDRISALLEHRKRGPMAE